MSENVINNAPINNYKFLKQEIYDGYGDDYGINTYYAKWKFLIDTLYDSVKNEPESLPYIFYEIEFATYYALEKIMTRHSITARRLIKNFSN